MEAVVTGPEQGQPTRPDFVHRYVRRGWRWVAAGAVISGLAISADWDGTNDVKDDLRSGIPVQATVGADYDGGQPIPLTYDHPTFGTTEVEATTWSIDPHVAAGDQIDVVASRIGPQMVDFPGDEYPRESPLWYVLPPLMLLLVVVRRRRRVRLTERMATSFDPPTTYLARVRRRTRPSRGTALDLYPVEAQQGAPPICSVPLMSSGGLPIGGAVFPVQVRARSRFSSSPAVRLRPFGWLTIRTEHEALWPSRRALGWRPAGLRIPFEGQVKDLPRPPDPQTVPTSPPLRLGLQRYATPLGLLIAGVLVGVITTVVSTAGYDDAREFERNGVEVPAEIVAVDDDDFAATISYRPPGQERDVEATTPVNYPEDWAVGDRTLAIVDPDDPGRARLLADSYDLFTPLLFGWMMVVPGLVWFGRRLLVARRLRRLRNGPWYLADVAGGTRPTWSPAGLFDLTLQRQGATSPSCRVRLVGRDAADPFANRLRTLNPPAPPPTPLPPGEQAPPWSPNYSTPWQSPTYTGEILVSGIPAPGEVVILRLGDVVVPAYVPAKLPKPPVDPDDHVGSGQPGLLELLSP